MTTQLKYQSEIHQNLPQVGNTPLLFFGSLSSEKIKIYAKAEWLQPGGSVKARAAHAIITDAIRSGKLNSKKSLLDASSGNTAIAYATLLKPLGWHPTICLPANASSERKKLLLSLGAQLILTSPLEGTDGAQKRAAEIAQENPSNYYYADQYSNENNWKAHYDTTANEIWDQTHGLITHFVAGLGTTGTFTGTGRRLRKLGNIKLIGLQPNQPLHALEGWKHLETAKVPTIYDPILADQILTIDSDDAFNMIRYVAQHENLLISPSAAANLEGAIEVAAGLQEGVIVTTLADNLDRYSEIKEEIF
ncbi:MAG: cysteine synthase family protein [Bacteroidota bacterium]|nr:cysteine synthase family protein [Bacteroidota bacterium]